MQSPIKMPDLELPKLDLSEFEVPKVDVGKAIAEAATAAGFGKPRRSRWPYILGVGAVVVVAGLAAMNAEAIRERLSRAKAWIGEQFAAMPPESGDLDPVAFAMDPMAPFDQPAQPADLGETGVDYPDGLGKSTETLATNGRSTAASRR